MIEYKSEEFWVEIATAELIERFRDAERVGAACRACPNYGCNWACPPFEMDAEEMLSRYERVTIVVTKITPTQPNQPIELARTLIAHALVDMTERLRDMEHEMGGLMCSGIGGCTLCPEGECLRLAGKPCCHPSEVRPSLEAYGFDVERLTLELFDLPLLWSNDGTIPPYLTTTCALLHN